MENSRTSSEKSLAKENENFTGVHIFNARKQVLNCMDWLNRNGANALLARLDAKQVKRLKVQRMYIFVLGHYLAHFFDEPAFDYRAV